MGRLDEFVKAKGLLTQAISLSLNSLPNNKSVQEARVHMKKALSELDNASKEENKKKATTDDQSKSWWKNVMSGTAATAHQPMSAEAQGRSLAQLNAMIAEEQKKLNDLEKQTTQPNIASQLFND
jgi:hypothetical protein